MKSEIDSSSSKFTISAIIFFLVLVMLLWILLWMQTGAPEKIRMLITSAPQNPVYDVFTEAQPAKASASELGEYDKMTNLAKGKNDSHLSKNPVALGSTSNSVDIYPLVIEELDHITISSPKADALYMLLTADFQLPVESTIKEMDYGLTALVNIGNTVLHIYNPPDYEYFGGSAIKSLLFGTRNFPEDTQRLLKKKDISHSPPFYFPDDPEFGTAVIALNDLAAEENYLAITDLPILQLSYHNEFTDSLTAMNGGPLGIIGIKSIDIGSVDTRQSRDLWQRLFSKAAFKSSNILALSNGIQLELKEADTTTIRSLTIKVHSLELAYDYLIAKNMVFSATDAEIVLQHEALEGIEIKLQH